MLTGISCDKKRVKKVSLLKIRFLALSLKIYSMISENCHLFHGLLNQIQLSGEIMSTMLSAN